MTTPVAPTASFSVRMPDDLRRRIKILAAAEDKSMNEWMVEALTLVAHRQEERNAGR